MKIIVCVKQVPDPECARFDEKSNTVYRDSGKMIINPLDMNAVEESIRIKEEIGGEVTVLSMGMHNVAELLREINALDVDACILLSDKAFAGADTLATSYTLSKGVEKIGAFDLIICGKQSTDGDTAQVGPSLAEKLNIPHIACVCKIEEIGDGYIRCKRVVDDGYEIVEMKLPGLITIAKGINVPRLPTLKGLMKAANTEIDVWNSDDIACETDFCGFIGSPTQVMESFIPARKVDSRMILGRPEEQVLVLIDEIMKIL